MYSYWIKILRVVDGDTLEVELDLGFHIKMKEYVRLLGVDTPEVFGPNAVPEGKIASQFTQDWVNRLSKSGKFSFDSVKYNARDKYGRSLGYIFHHDINGIEGLNEALINAGMLK